MEGTDEHADDLPLLFGRVLDGKGGARPLDWAQVQEWRAEVAPEEVLWVHLKRSEPGVEEWLRNKLGISEPSAELLVSSDNRPRAFREGDALVATLRAVNFNPGAAPEDMVSLQLWSDGRCVVTLRRAPLQTPHSICRELDEGAGPLDAGALITALTEHLIERMGRSILDMNEVIDQLEDDQDNADIDELLVRITGIRRNCLALKRHMSPQHEALENIAAFAPAWFEDHDRREVSEAIARLRRYLDDIDISKESALVMQDDIRTRVLARSEEKQFLLAIVAAIFLPLSFLTGLLGINVGGIPYAENQHAFWYVVLICGGIMALLAMVFRRRGWF